MTKQEQALKELYDGVVATGTLNPNAVLPKIFNKIATQRVVQTFNFKHNLVKKYMKNTSLFGDIDEILVRKFEQLQRDGKDSAGEGIKDKKLLQAVSVGITRKFDDQYPYTLTDVMAQAAFKDAATFGSIIGEMRNMVYDSKAVKGYDRIIDTYENGYTNVITIPRTLKGAELQKYLIKLLKDMTFVSTAYNVASIENVDANTTAYSLEQLDVTGNVDHQVDFQTDVSLNFNSKDVPVLNRLYSAQYAKFTDAGKDILCVIDTADTIHVGLEKSGGDFQHFAEDRYTNYYLNEMYKMGINPFTLGVVIKYEAETPDTMNLEQKTDGDKIVEAIESHMNVLEEVVSNEETVKVMTQLATTMTKLNELIEKLTTTPQKE